MKRLRCSNGSFPGINGSQCWMVSERPLALLLAGGELESTTAETTLPGAPDGNYWIIVFNTRFANKASAVETLVMIDEEGKWLPVGYYIR